jgi:hypothetical protein
MPGFMVCVLAGATDPDRPRERGAIAGDRRRLKAKFLLPAGRFLGAARGGCRTDPPDQRSDVAAGFLHLGSRLIALEMDPPGWTDYQVPDTEY